MIFPLYEQESRRGVVPGYNRPPGGGAVSGGESQLSNRVARLPFYRAAGGGEDGGAHQVLERIDRGGTGGSGCLSVLPRFHPGSPGGRRKDGKSKEKHHRRANPRNARSAGHGIFLEFLEDRGG